MLTAGHQQAPGELLELEPLSSFPFPGLAGLLLRALGRPAGRELRTVVWRPGLVSLVVLIHALCQVCAGAPLIE